MGKIILPVFLFLLLALTAGPLRAGQAPIVPEPLKPWTGWVLHGHQEELLCTPDYNDSTSLRCDWPGRLVLDLNAKGGTFRQEWQAANPRWLQLPGGKPHWPAGIRLDGKVAPVLNHLGHPAVWVKAGHHVITGSFGWPALPVFLPVSPQTGLIDLQLSGSRVAAPNLDVNGRLWLKSETSASQEVENRLQLEVFRLIDDRIPARLITALDLDVSGTAREIVLGPLFPPASFIPLRVQSPLPARLEGDGRLRLQVRPGHWQLRITTRHLGPLTDLSYSRPDDGFWPGAEIWSFAAHPDLRIVEISGPPAIDPQQTNLPPEWRANPAYRLTAGATMHFKEVKRGDPHPAPDQLSLARNIWLRFDGSGYTFQDTITGRKNSGWRLEMNPPLDLGRVTVDGREQFITRLAGSPRTGVELRQGTLQLVADSIYRGPLSSLPAVGWAHDFQQVRANLMLPPGWRLIQATGADKVTSTWLNRWSLLDLFIVLIFSLATARLYSRRLALLALVTLTLTWHEPLAPHWVWPVLLTGFALLKYLPPGGLKKTVRWGQLLALLAFLVIAIPFDNGHLRVGLFPQLEKPWQSMTYPSGRLKAPTLAKKAVPAAPLLQETPLGGRRGETLEKSARVADQALSSLNISGSESNLYQPGRLAQYAPGMQLQTGPGLPTWHWHTVALNWSGPVRADQRISLWLLGPAANLVLAGLRVLLLIVLILGLLRIGYRRGSGLKTEATRKLFLFGLAIALLLLPSLARAASFPPPELLTELQHRLLEKDKCFPDCADLEQLNIELAPDRLALNLTLAAHLETAVPLPGDSRFWLPERVRLDGTENPPLLRTGNTLWLQVPAGIHRVSLSGRLTGQTVVQLPLPMPPRHLTIKAKGWSVEGVRPDGSAENQLQFKRLAKESGQPPEQILESGVLPPFLRVERTILLGLVWKVETRVTRLSPPGSAVVLDLPLLPGESVTTEGLRSHDGKVQINLSANQNSLAWESFLAPTDRLVLRHAETSEWTEIWRVDVSPIFHLEYQGIPVILNQQGDRWFPTWHPWPGEEVKLSISRPAGVPGQTLTVDKATLSFSPGRRASDTTLTLDLRSSQGGQHTIVLPPKALLEQVKVRGQVQPISQEGRRVPLPISPGSQEIVLQWREPTGIATLQKTPEVNLGLASVNTDLELELPASRWPLLVGGPRMGPALLFWSVLLLIALAAGGLAKTGLAPLKFHQWLLLGIGMSQSNVYGALLVVAWLIGLELRGKVGDDFDHDRYNAMQVGLAVLSATALAALVAAISRGLLGHPDMSIVGNGSNASLLRWYQDASPALLPQAWLLSIPMYWYRLAMLAWALWLSFALIGIFKWGWGNFSRPVLWYKPEKKSGPGRGGKGKKDTETAKEEPLDLTAELRKEEE